MKDILTFPAHMPDIIHEVFFLIVEISSCTNLVFIMLFSDNALLQSLYVFCLAAYGIQFVRRRPWSENQLTANITHACGHSGRYSKM
jgi:hypothetical protein